MVFLFAPCFFSFHPESAALCGGGFVPVHGPVGRRRRDLPLRGHDDAGDLSLHVLGDVEAEGPLHVVLKADNS